VNLEARVMDLESRLAFQDDTIQALNDVLVSQQNAVDRLQLQMAALLKRQEEMGGQFESFEEEDEAIANCVVPAETARAIMLHFITRIVICSFGFRKSTAVPPELLSGRLFLFVSAQTYITPTVLAILAIKSFQLLYSYATKSTLYAALWQLCVVSDMLCMLFFMSETAKLTADPY